MSKKGLERLNIENLFSNDLNKPITNGRLDINTLFKKSIDDDKVEFKSEILLNTIHKKREKINKTYNMIYKSCCDKIVSANSAGITDIIHEIPIVVQECIGYNSLDCLIFIQNKLQEQSILTKLLTKSKIFITWNALEKHLLIQKSIK